MVKFVIHFLFLVAAVAHLARRGPRLLAHARLVHGRASSPTASTGSSSSPPRRRPGATSTRPCSRRSARYQRGGINVFGAVGRLERLPRERADARSEPPRDHAHRPAPRAAPDLPAARAWAPAPAFRSPLTLAFLAVVELATLSRSGLLGILAGLVVLAIPYRRFLLSARFLVPLALVVARDRHRRRAAQRVLRDGAPGADERRRRLDPRPPRDLRAAAAGDRPAPAVRARPEHVLFLLRVRHRASRTGARTPTTSRC